MRRHACILFLSLEGKHWWREYCPVVMNYSIQELKSLKIHIDIDIDLDKTVLNNIKSNIKYLMF